MQDEFRLPAFLEPHFYPYDPDATPTTPSGTDVAFPQGMAKTEQSLMEAETHIRWDMTDAPAVLWTADPKVRKEWESFGFKPTEQGKGWRAEVPKDRISYKTVKKA